MFEKFEEYVEELVFENLLTAKYFLFHISENQCAMKFLKHGNVCSYTCDYCTFCPFSLKIGPVDDSNTENEENVEYQVFSYCKHNHDKTFLSEKAAAYRSGDLAICIYERDELLKKVDLIKKEGKEKKKGKSYRSKEVSGIRVEISRLNKKICELEEKNERIVMGDFRYFSEEAYERFERAKIELPAKVNIVRGEWYLNMKNYSYRGVCGVTSDNMIECPVVVDGNVVTLKFPVDNCKDKKGKKVIMNEIRKRAGLESEREMDASEDEENLEVNEQQKGSKNKESMKRYNTRGARIDYEELVRFGVRRLIESDEPLTEDSMDAIPIYMGLYKSVYDLYLVCYPRRTKYYTPFSFCNEDEVVFDDLDKSLMTASMFKSRTGSLFSDSKQNMIFKKFKKDDIEGIQTLRCIILLSMITN